MNFLRNLFRGKPKKPPLPPINEDWKAGDWAECISSNWITTVGADVPKMGRKYLVGSVFEGELFDSGLPSWGLSLVGLNPGTAIGYVASCFRKVSPDAFEEPRIEATKIGRKEGIGG